MSKLDEVFFRIQKTKREQKKIRDTYKDALVSYPSYQKTVEELNELKEKKKKIEADVKADFRNDFTKLEDLKIDLDTDLEMLSDLAMTQLMKGETVKITDEENQIEYEPVFNVRFRKAK